jgi:agmatinase
VTADAPGFLEDKLDPGAPSAGPNRFVLSLIPYEETTTYRKGTAHAPEAIVDASGHVELFDETMEVDASTYGVLTLRPDITDLGSITDHARSVRQEHPEALLGFVGGEHSVTPAIVEGLAREEMGIVWIDAHADLRRSFYGRTDNHACAGFNSLPFGPIVQIGVRTLAEEEHQLLRESERVRAFREWESEAHDAVLALPQDIYLSLDMDGFAPEVVRAVGTPEPGGLYWDEVMEILDVLFTHKNVFAFDTVELCPVETDVASEFIAAKVIYKIMSYHAHHKLGGPPA